MKKTASPSPAASSRSTVQGVGSCGCANATQGGGSLASDAIVSMVTKDGWVAMDANATDKFGAPYMSGGGGIESLFQNFATVLNHPMVHKGGDSIADVAKTQLAKIKKTKPPATKKGKLSGGGDDTLLNGVESLADLLSPDVKSAVMTVQKKAMNGGYGDVMDMVNQFMNGITLAGAQKLGAVINDKSLFESGKSISTYVAEMADTIPSGPAKDIVAKLASVNKGNVMKIADRLTPASLDKVAALTGQFKSKVGGGAKLKESIAAFAAKGASESAKPRKSGAEKKKPLPKTL